MQWYIRNGAKERDLRADAEAVEALARAVTGQKRVTSASKSVSNAEIGQEHLPKRVGRSTPHGPAKSILWRRGIVRSFNSKTRSGIVVQRDGTEVLVRSAALRTSRVPALEPGESVWFQVGRVKNHQVVLRLRRQ